MPINVTNKKTVYDILIEGQTYNYKGFVNIFEPTADMNMFAQLNVFAKNAGENDDPIANITYNPSGDATNSSLIIGSRNEQTIMPVLGDVVAADLINMIKNYSFDED